MIIGIGTDIVQIKRIELIYKKFGRHFATRILHKSELEIMETMTHERQAAFLARRFAGKEAIAKAFGTGIGPALSFKEIMIINDEKGQPIAKIENEKQFINKNYHIHISLADDYPIAIAFAVVSKYTHHV